MSVRDPSAKDRELHRDCDRQELKRLDRKLSGPFRYLFLNNVDLTRFIENDGQERAL